MKQLCTLLLLSVSVMTSCTMSEQVPEQIQSFNLSDIRLLDSDFRHAQEMDMRYILGIDPDRLLAPYLKEAGLTPKADNYTNWENTGLDGHVGGHYLSALSYMYASTGYILEEASHFFWGKS